jgi:non-specific serine/threonine protein kinase
MLTPQILDSFPFYQYTDYKTVQRGQQYYRDGHVTILEYSDNYVLCQVIGHNDDYEVEISLGSKNRIQFGCTCPQAEIAHVCKHMVAAALAASQYLKSDTVQNDWQYRLGQALEATPRRKAGTNAQKYVALYLLQSSTYYQGRQFYLTPSIVKASDWTALRISSGVAEDVNRLLDEDHNWAKYIEQPYQTVNPMGCLNLSPEAIAFFNFTVNGSGYYHQFSNFGPYMPLLAKMDAPIFLMNERKKLGERLQIISEPVEVRAALARDGGNLSLQAGIELSGQLFTSGKENLSLVSSSPPWVLLGRYLAPVANPESLSLLEAFPVEIPAEDENIFREKYFRKIAERAPIDGEAITWDDVKADALPRLYLRKEKETLFADLRFGYGNYEVSSDPNPLPVTTLDIPGSWSMARIHRQAKREAEFYELLTDSRYGLKRAGREHPYGTFEMRARTHPYDFLIHSIPALTQAGFEIYGDRESLGKINPNPPTIRVSISSGIDWFDLQAVVQYGDQEVPLREIRKALKKGDHYIKLADGSIGQIPEIWLERYKHLFDLSQETEDGLRVSDMQLSLLDELLSDAAQAEIVPEFHKKRERLRTMDGVKPVAIPQGFQGELRPYQKAGVDWLHFLREYGFGGILADDMGLGKTVQVLVFLQSLKEQAAGSASSNGATAASLLVVPKSLLTNWQRESAKFTPGLRILVYYGTTRKKDEPENFNDYDIILTTYGTMLKDIEHLRAYCFHYAILDEAQAIKNAMAQSSKAARLLKAEHRLTITGTPVENNTFELWSQFAFTNPGLLGGVDYFKREFATPIESRGDGDTAKLLRRMVYPFILRRTKEQVAPELPPRTERMVYTELEPAQRKIYEHTRERYRSELLGLIDEGGINDARMKILEGLLRLRQICIHPVLVEPTFKGDVAKFDALLETLETLKAEGHKALVFSQFVQTLRLLEVEMMKRGLEYVYLDGQTRDRQAEVDRFQNDPTVPFFLISLKAGGVGLNLTAADYVLHLDPWWNPAVEMQAADRAHRIGQDKPVFIYKFIARDTVEEKILELQARKRDLVEQLISAEGSFFKSITREDVKVLFS